eukprot:CAMPEP_0202116488 /NCGR_PEP_ID=MMETSP0965-20130614/40707_1 /ASSEMBLY_ACC=CAM_ASM_000507 /TAXON_ID=4773 /ORGANISM="Schizochytrium aggregatum, Strain ATCC28209" /LENGTH=67 /DNA_ID=CAMNT_0048686351 /DNA_START=35 /DNA_END=235 /DNA_ORIENTATION=-
MTPAAALEAVLNAACLVGDADARLRPGAPRIVREVERIYLSAADESDVREPAQGLAMAALKRLLCER